MIQYEAAAELRLAATALWGLYVSLVQEGFSEEQALQIELAAVAK